MRVPDGEPETSVVEASRREADSSSSSTTTTVVVCEAVDKAMAGWCFKKRAVLVFLFSSLLLLILLASQAGAGGGDQLSVVSSSPSPLGGGGVSTSRMGPDDCSGEDVMVYQSIANPLPSGIPSYSVQIVNVCQGCTVFDVHVSCGEFASTELVDPGKFQRVGFNDCVVKGGAALEPSETVSFQYSNSFSYQLNVASVACDHKS